MSYIELPGRFTSQPQYAAPLDKRHPLYPHIIFAYSAGRGPQDGRHTTAPGSYVGTVQRKTGRFGRAVIPADDSGYTQFGNVEDYNQVGNITIIARIKTAGLTVQQGVVTKCETSGGANTPFALLTEAGGAIGFNRSGPPGGVPFRVWASAATLSADTNQVIAVTQVGDMSVAPRFYIDGTLDAGSPTSLYGGAGTGSPTGNATSIKIGNRTDLASRCYHDVYDVLILKDVLPPHEVYARSKDLDAIWQAPARRLWAASPSGTADITGAGQISSAEGFGFTALGAGIAAAGVASTALLGNASVTAGITATGIASAEAAGSPAASAVITAPGIAAAEAFGSPVLSPAIVLTAIASAEALGVPAVSGTAPAEITGTGQIVTAEALGSPALGITITAAGVVDAEAFGSAALSAAVAAASITSAETVGAPEVGGAAPAEITGTGQIAAGEAMGSPAIRLSITASGLETTEVLGSAALSVRITSGSIATAEAVGLPAIAEAGPVEPAEISSAGGIASAERFGAASVHPFVPYTGTGFHVGSGNRRPRPSRQELPPAATPHRLGVVGIGSQARLGYPTLKWQGRSRKVRDEELLLGRAAA